MPSIFQSFGGFGDEDMTDEFGGARGAKRGANRGRRQTEVALSLTLEVRNGLKRSILKFFHISIVFCGTSVEDASHN